MAFIFSNNLYRSVEARQLCKAVGIKMVPSALVVQMAQKAGFDALFIDMEHSTLSIHETSQMCTAGLLAEVTPFVRVPHQCGNGLIQKVLDGGAMGVIFPHIDSKGRSRAGGKTSSGNIILQTHTATIRLS
ncbi:uncharacterized protein PV07_02142 [Cladophialophora immunda]|uniref:HpcH/HpaI aldolase/citrate lyase domain-containing protein n=1 Tax=Cladophialophora immunda TaxID=569365 RepID=A0A0D2CZQ3_9EURO|nr:uncharacterized protein PV07_02142 [Cladophialophora immunda]KIW35445.1 hypothetical protein PV07_02142 [Cladophialophora immunda]